MLFDVTPGETNAIAFLLGQALRWAGVALFLGLAWNLGRRIGDWRIPALAVAALVLPEVVNEVGWLLIQDSRERDTPLSMGTMVSGLVMVSRTIHIAALAALVLLSARLVAERRREHPRLAAR